MNTEPEEPTAAELQMLQRMLTSSIEMFDRQTVHFRRQRLFLAWGALALAAASTASLFVSESVVQFTLGGMQAVLWTVIAVMNFGGPSISELLARLIKRKP